MQRTRKVGYSVPHTHKQTHGANPVFFLPSEQKEEKDGLKTEESGKLQNGENSKEGVAAAGMAVNVSEEKKKATKQRFMFNIADGGFTGTHTDLRSANPPQLPNLI